MTQRELLIGGYPFEIHNYVLRVFSGDDKDISMGVMDADQNYFCNARIFNDGFSDIVEFYTNWLGESINKRIKLDDIKFIDKPQS